MKKKLGLAAVISIMLIAMLVLAACQLSGAEDPPTNLARPYISVQPESRSFFTDNYVPYTLKVEVWDWVQKEGAITYQWYSFTDIDDYCINGGTPISGATQASYAPTDVTAEANKLYYFYVVITNTNSNTLDVTSAKIQSEIATIAFSAPGKNSPLFPIVSRSPADASYGWGRALNAIKVDARLPKVLDNYGDEVPASGTLTYQWYSNSERKIAGGVPVPGADKASFIPGYDTLNINQNYFYVVVTNTISEIKVDNSTEILGEVKLTTIPATINMQPGLRAAEPRIEKQPADRLFFNTGEIQPLTVKALSPDLGNLSFQWYSNTSAVNTGGTEAGVPDTPVKDANGIFTSTFTPPGNNGFYYVKITNTNENVSSEDKTASITSKAVQVRIAAAGSLSENVTVTIPDPTNLSNQRQYVRGYGGMHVAWDNFPRLDAQDTELMYNPDKMGYNILRIMIRPDNIDIKKTMDDMVYGSLRQFYADYYENCRIVNQYGGYVAASPWTPPKEWKSNNSINGGGNLIPSYYRLFANYLRTFAQIMYDNGAPIYCISISNEPNYVAGYDGCEWSPSEMKNFWEEIGHFTDGIRGYGGGREIPYVLTMNGESANTPYINREVLRNPKTKAVVDVLARHIYGERTKSLWNDYPAELQKGAETDLNKGRVEVWMTEHNINSANATGYYNDSTWNYVWRYLNDVDLVMRINNENAFVWWASKRFYSMVGDGQFGTTEHAPLPRGWALTHYARYTTDTTRLYLDNITGTMTHAGGNTVNIANEVKGSNMNDPTDNMDNTSVRITAYVSQDGNEISMVMWTPTQVNGNDGFDLGNVKIVLPFAVNGVKAHRSYQVKQVIDGKDVYIDHLFEVDDSVLLASDRMTAYVNMPRSQILSIRFTK